MARTVGAAAGQVTRAPQNLVSRKPYRGVNVFLLHAMHYTSPYWLTFKQAQELGGHVRKGEKACPVVFWKWLEVDKDGETERVPFLRYYSVFNVAQCEGIDSHVPSVLGAIREHSPVEAAERIAEIVRNAVLFGPDAWEGASLPERKVNASERQHRLPNDRDVVELFTLLGQRQIPYLLVGGIAMLRCVEGRNTEDIDLLMSLSSLRELPEITIEEQADFLVKGRFRSLRVDVSLTANALFAEAQQGFGTSHRFAELEVPTATPEGLVLLKLYALPSLYRQGQIDRVAIYEADITSLIQRHQVEVEPLLHRLRPHVLKSDLRELRSIVRDIEVRITRFEHFKKKP